MTDEIRIYHIDDPNDAPERRLAAFPTINPFIPTSLPQYVIPPVANSLYAAMQYYWYSAGMAYQHGIASKKQEQQQLQQQQQQQLLSQQNHHHHLQHAHHNLNLNPHHHRHSQPPASPSSSLGLTSSSSSSSSSSASSTGSHASTAQLASSSCSSTSSVIAPSSLGPSSSASSSASSAGSSAASPVTSTTPATTNHHHQHHQDGDHVHTNCHQDTSVTSRRLTEDGDQQQQQKPHQHIKKPLNPFMIYMQKRRPEIVKQGIIKESAAINQMLGQQWRKLTKEEQEPYYKLAEQEKILHAQKYPGWSARDNYANQKKKKKMKLKSISLNGLDQSDKKCRARFGLNNMASWCKPCKRKKKCIYNKPSLSHHHHHHHHHHNHHHHENHHLNDYHNHHQLAIN